VRIALKVTIDYVEDSLSLATTRGWRRRDCAGQRSAVAGYSQSGDAANGSQWKSSQQQIRRTDIIGLAHSEWLGI